MSVIAAFSIPAGEFVLGRALSRTSGLSVELEQVLPTGGTTIPYFWVVGEGRRRFDDVLADAAELSAFEAVDELDDRTLYRAEWEPTRDTFVRLVVEHDAVLLEASGDADAWEFRLLFPDTNALSSFHTACKEAGIDVTVESLFDSIDASADTRGLTEAQRTLVERAFDEGYFDVPRQITLAELADDLDISDQAVNERLRRGLKSIVDASLIRDRES